jgi:hypothetical protein
MHIQTTKRDALSVAKMDGLLLVEPMEDAGETSSHVASVLSVTNAVKLSAGAPLDSTERSNNVALFFRAIFLYIFFFIATQ